MSGVSPGKPTHGIIVEGNPGRDWSFKSVFCALASVYFKLKPVPGSARCIDIFQSQMKYVMKYVGDLDLADP